MLKIGLASAALIVVWLGAVAHLFGESFERRGESVIARKGPAGLGLSGYQQSPEAYLMIHREVVWHPDQFGASPFGFIPTQWTTRPQLLPLTWDVRTVFAADDAGDANLGRGDVRPRVKTARVD